MNNAEKKLAIQLVNVYYDNLQIYGNEIFNIDIHSEHVLSTDYNLKELIKTYNRKNPGKISGHKLRNLREIIKQLITFFMSNFTTNTAYMKDQSAISYFTRGSNSPNIIINIDNKLLKLVPLSWFHHYEHFFQDNFTHQDYIPIHIETPLFAIYLREAWFIRFANIYLKKYTPAFDSLLDFRIINGFPVPKQNIAQLSNGFGLHRPKDWFYHLLETNTDMSDFLYESSYMCIEMNHCENTLFKDILQMEELRRSISILESKINITQLDESVLAKLRSRRDETDHAGVRAVLNRVIKRQQTIRVIKWKINILSSRMNPLKFSLSMLFEYLYAKLVCGVVGRIIFTDDHFDNIMYTHSDLPRKYLIKSGGTEYVFNATDRKMIQFIDVERYIFNGSSNLSFTNDILRQKYHNDKSNVLQRNMSKDFARHRRKYVKNDYIFDKGIYSFLDPRELPSFCFQSVQDYEIMTKILLDERLYHIDTFCEVLNQYLPVDMRSDTVQSSDTIQSSDALTYQIDLDDLNLSQIKHDDVVG